jgi:hypothetical protein
MSFDKLLQSFRYKSTRGVSAINEAVEDIGIECLYAKTQTTKNLGLFDKKVLKDEDEIRSFKTFLFNLYPDFFFVIKKVNDEQIGIKVCKRVRMEKCIIETIYIDTGATCEPNENASETGSSESSVEIDNQSVASEASYSTISSISSFTSIYASKERVQTYGRSTKVIEQDKKKQEAKEQAKKEQEAKEQAKKEQEAKEQELKKKKCDFFHTKNGCYHGDACRFRH